MLSTRPKDEDSKEQLKTRTAACYKDSCQSVDAEIPRVRNNKKAKDVDNFLTGSA